MSTLKIARLVVDLSFYYYLFSTPLVGEKLILLSAQTIEEEIPQSGITVMGLCLFSVF
jgi:hypothetical protein